jgi:glucose-1-phosphate cytidylyltransferase
VKIDDLVAFHQRSKTLATMTAIQPPSKYGVLSFEENLVTEFEEKPAARDRGWINGGYFVLSPKVIDLIDSAGSMWEHEPVRRLVKDGQLAAYKHDGFWQCMDTLRDRMTLDSIWAAGAPPWKVWD